MKSLRRCLATSVLMLISGSPPLSGAQEPEQATLEVQTGHAFLVDAVTFSADGKYAVTGAEDGRVALWEVATGAELREFLFSDVLSVGIKSVAISPGNEAILAGTQVGGIVMEFEMGTGKGRGMLKSPSPGAANSINSIALSSGGRLIFTAEESGATRVWNSVSAESVELPEHARAVTAVALSPDNQLIGAASKDHTATLVAMKTGEVSQTLSGHSDEVLAIAFSRDGELVVTGSADQTARVWDAASGRLLRTFTASSRVNRVVFSKDGTRVYAQTNDSIVAWETSTGKQAFTIPQPEDHEPALAISPDGKLLLSSGGAALGRAAVIWDAATGERVRELSGGAALVFSAKFSADGRYLGTGSQDGTAALWDLRTGHQAFVVQAGQKPIRSVDISRDGSYLLTGGADGAVSSWSTETGELLRTFRQPDGQWVNSVAIAANTKEILAGGKDGVTRIWSEDPRYLPLELKAAKGEVKAVAFSPKNDFVLSGGDDGVLHQWLVGRAEPILLKGHNHPINAITISSDARYAISTDSDECLLWNLESGSLMSRIPATDGASFTSVAFSPDEDQFVLGASDAAMIWRQSAKKALPLAGHEQRVQGVGFSPDSKFVVTASVDGTARIWDAVSGTELAMLVTFPGGWTVTDPSGRFDTNMLEGGAPLHWIVDSAPLNPLPLEIFLRDYYTPGLLARVMKREKLLEVRSIAEITNRVQPAVKVVSVTPSITMPGRVDVTVQAASHTDEKGVKSELQDLRLFRDGQMVGSGWVEVLAACAGAGTEARRVAGGYIEGSLRDCDFTFHDVLLKSDAKKVAFTAYAFNGVRIKSATANLEYEPKTSVEANSVRRRAYLLQVGVDHYAASGCELHDAVNDAEAMSAGLKERLEKQGFAVEAVKLESVADDSIEAASKAEIRKRLAEIAAKATPDDAFFTSFSGHGYSAAGGEFYILPSSTLGTCQYPDEAQLKEMLASAISADELADWLRPIDAGEMTLILDACHSAESVQAGDFKPGPMGSRGLGQVAYDKRMRVLAASQSTEVAHEYDYLGEGLLTYTLTHDGLDGKNADWKPKDGKITVGEWLAYAANAVPQFKAQTDQSTQKAVIPVRTDGKTLTPVSTPRPQVPALFDFSKTDSLVLQ